MTLLYLVSLLVIENKRFIFINLNFEIIGIFASDEDEENAYREKEGWLGRSIRRGTDKAIKALTLGLISGSDPVTELGKDAAQEFVTKVVPRSMESDDED